VSCSVAIVEDLCLFCHFSWGVGIILVHDLNNVKSCHNLWKWVTEALTPPKKTKDEDAKERWKKEADAKVRGAEMARGLPLLSDLKPAVCTTPKISRLRLV